jgi:hypothetical protein
MGEVKWDKVIGGNLKRQGEWSSISFFLFTKGCFFGGKAFF